MERQTDQSHTPEPWQASYEGNDEWVVISDGKKWKSVAETRANREGAGEVSAEEAKANARRIVACVNACAGIPTDQLTPGSVRDLQRDHAHLLRKIAHGCTDANCKLCDEGAS